MVNHLRRMSCVLFFPSLFLDAGPPTQDTGFMLRINKLICLFCRGRIATKRFTRPPEADKPLAWHKRHKKDFSHRGNGEKKGGQDRYGRPFVRLL